MSDKVLDNLLDDLRESSIAYGEELHHGRVKSREQLIHDTEVLLGMQDKIKQLVAEAVKQAKIEEIEMFREAMINHSTPMAYAPKRIAELKGDSKTYYVGGNSNYCKCPPGTTHTCEVKR